MQNSASPENIEAIEAGLAALSCTVERIIATLDRYLARAAVPDESLSDKIDAVIKGVSAGKVPPPQVDLLHAATGKARTDRAVGRAIGARPMEIGLKVVQ